MGFITFIMADASLPLHPRDVELTLSILNFLVGTMHILPGKFNLEYNEITQGNIVIHISLFIANEK
jgi:hypothetical protein